MMSSDACRKSRDVAGQSNADCRGNADPVGQNLNAEDAHFTPEQVSEFDRKKNR